MRLSLSGLSTFLLAVMLAVLVWFVAVSEANPFEARTLSAPVAVTLTNLPADLILVGTEPANPATTVTVRAPRTVWDELNAAQVQVTADLTGVDAATYEVKLQWRILDEPAARVVKMEPDAIVVVLERRTERDKPIRLDRGGEPAPGYESGEASLSTGTAQVAGPASIVDRVSELVATVSLVNLKSSLDQTVVLVPVDSAGAPVAGLTVTPATVRVRIPVTQKVGSRDVVVRAVIQGQIAAGYQFTNITVAPPIITVSSADPARVTELPGFVETAPLDITGATDDVTQRLALILPEGVTPVGGDPTVVVQVSIAAIEGSTQVERRLEPLNLGVGLVARVSPESVDVLLSGPLPVLNQLEEGDVRVLLDLDGLAPGTYQITPTVVLLPSQLTLLTVQPSPVEVIVERGQPATSTPSPTITLTPSRTPRPTFTATLVPPTPSPAAPSATPPPPDGAPPATDTPPP
ncbi:MAG: hypothetical protein JNK29_12535 [Anaerolineales bacterium]|nr:hypothetical protein [Anaerolineales bacterium]